MNISPWKFLAVSALVLVASGCSGSGPQLYKAVGTVTNNKVPVEGAQVTFAYDNGNFANGYTDADGKFELTYMNRPGGAVPGKCTVTVSKKGAATSTPPPAILDATPKSKEEQQAKQAAQQKVFAEFEKKQAEAEAAGGSENFTKTGWVLEVTTDENANNFLIDLKDSKK